MGTPNRLTDKRRNMYESMKGVRTYHHDLEFLDYPSFDHDKKYGDIVEEVRRISDPEVRITNFRDAQGERMYGYILVETEQHSWFTRKDGVVATLVKPGTPGPSATLEEGWDSTPEISWCCQLLLKKTEDEIWEAIKNGEFLMEVYRTPEEDDAL